MKPDLMDINQLDWKIAGFHTDGDAVTVSCQCTVKLRFQTAAEFSAWLNEVGILHEGVRLWFDPIASNAR